MFEVWEYVKDPLTGIGITAFVSFGIAACYVIGVAAVVATNAMLRRMGHSMNPGAYAGACDLAGLFAALAGLVFSVITASKWMQVL